MHKGRATDGCSQTLKVQVNLEMRKKKQSADNQYGIRDQAQGDIKGQRAATRRCYCLKSTMSDFSRRKNVPEDADAPALLKFEWPTDDFPVPASLL